MAVTWLPNQASFIGALDAGAQAGLRSAALQQQAMAQQAAIDEANARRQAAEIEAQNRLNFESWYRGEQLRQQAAQDAMLRDKYNEELGYKKQQLEKAMESEAARKAYWENMGNQPAKPFILSQGAKMVDATGKQLAENPRITTAKPINVTVKGVDAEGNTVTYIVPKTPEEIAEMEKSQKEEADFEFENFALQKEIKNLQNFIRENEIARGDKVNFDKEGLNFGTSTVWHTGNDPWKLLDELKSKLAQKRNKTYQELPPPPPPPALPPQNNIPAGPFGGAFAVPQRTALPKPEIIQVKTRAERDALPSGTRYVGPDGIIAIKQ